MKVMGLIACTLAVCLVTASAQPLFLGPGIAAALGANGLVLSTAAAAGAVPAGTVLATIPLVNLVAGKAALVGAGVAKGFILNELINSRRNAQSAPAPPKRMPKRRHH